MSAIKDSTVENVKNSTNLEYIKILGLYGRYNIKISFDKEVNIFVGENGLGKTTILNCVYYLLTKQFERLKDIKFNSIHVKIKNEKNERNIHISDINAYLNQKSRRHLYTTERIELFLNEIVPEFSSSIYTENEFIEKATRRIVQFERIPLDVARRVATEYFDTHFMEKSKTSRKGNAELVKKLISSFESNIHQKVHYLTTYRRIESDFPEMFNKDMRFRNDDILIQFGMSDVEKTIKNILEEIRNESIESFNKMTGVLLKQYSASKVHYELEKIKSVINNDDVEIILNRLGDQIGGEDKNRILRLLNSGSIYENEYSYLLDLIEKLIENYNTQKTNDDRIKNFVQVCNKYLNNKKFIYDQSNLKLDVALDFYDNISNQNTLRERISLRSLSSGEKQIVSLFSKLYLEKDSDMILLIDEPELSLSMKWQRMLLPDIIRSGRCKLLLTVTHSPYIFENEFDYDAKEIRTNIDLI